MEDENTSQPPASLSALDGWVDVCRTGEYQDMSGRDVAVDAALLDRLVAVYAAADPAPVVVGHPETDAPAYGWVSSLRRVGDRLQARFSDIDDAFRAAVEAQRYTNRSIAFDGDVLRHIGFLGGAAPAVPGLAPTRFSSAAAQVIAFAAADLATSDTERWGWRAVARTLRSLRDWIIEKDGVEKADNLIPDWDIEAIRDAAADETQGARALAAPSKDNQPKKEGAVPEAITTETGSPGADSAALAAEREALEAERAELAAERERIEAERAATEAARRLATAEAALEGHVQAGRVLPAERAGLAALLASLPADRTIRLAGPDGAAVETAPGAVLERFMAAVPARIRYDEVAGDDTAPIGGGDLQAKARRSRALLAADETGETNIAQAVRQRRAAEGESDA